MSLFDECFSTYSTLTEKPKKWKSFWENELNALKEIPFEIKRGEEGELKNINAKYININFQSYNKYNIYSKLIIPKKVDLKNSKSSVIVLFPDYFKNINFYEDLLKEEFAYFIIRLRGHENYIDLRKPVSDSDQSVIKSYGFFSENLLHIKNYYMKNLYLDAYRALEVIRLQKEIDTSKIAIWGTGIGAAMAVFVSSFMKRTSALFLENPSFSHLAVTQNISKSDYAREINKYLKVNNSARISIKSNLSILDAMYFADDLDIPVCMGIDLRNKETAPHGGFALFHRLPSEKDMHIITENLSSDSVKESEPLLIDAAKEFFIKNLK
ncbi:MAG: acetylxylan esterase [Spirochaetia bacterium]|nr:acetylxylan esterase [Spirochaetia bacterium]